MWKYSRRRFKNVPGSSSFEAACHSYTAYKITKKKKKKMNEIGSLLFYTGKICPSIVVHELAHATNYFFNRHKIKLNFGGKPDSKWKEGEEVYAWTLGYMVDQFWKKYKGKINKNINY